MKKTLKEELEESFQRWDNELYSGGSDPYYSDGVDMNLLRKHIIKRRYWKPGSCQKYITGKHRKNCRSHLW